MSDAPIARRGARVDPGELPETVPLVIHKIFRQMPSACLQRDDADALAGKFAGDDAAACAGADDDDDAVVIQIKWSCHDTSPRQSQLMSLKPRSI